MLKDALLFFAQIAVKVRNFNFYVLSPVFLNVFTLLFMWGVVFSSPVLRLLYTKKIL